MEQKKKKRKRAAAEETLPHGPFRIYGGLRTMLSAAHAQINDDLMSRDGVL